MNDFGTTLSLEQLLERAQKEQDLIEDLVEDDTIGKDTSGKDSLMKDDVQQMFDQDSSYID